MARRMRWRGGARRQHRAASAPQTQARRRTAKSGRAPVTGTSARYARSRRIPWKCGRFPEMKGAADARTRGRRGDRGRRQSCDCRAPAAQGATRERARAATAGNRTRLYTHHTPHTTHRTHTPPPPPTHLHPHARRSSASYARANPKNWVTTGKGALPQKGSLWYNEVRFNPMTTPWQRKWS